MQPDGSPPTVVTRGTARGESGVAVVHLSYQGGCYVEVELRQISEGKPEQASSPPLIRH
jgi:hypothetical protein